LSAGACGPGAADLFIPEAINEVVVHEADGLHKGIADRGADEAEASFLKVLAHDVGFFGVRRNALVSRPSILFRRAVDEAPDVFVEGAEFVAQLQERTSVADGGVDLKSVADDARIGEKRALFAGVVARDFFGIEGVEDFAIADALTKNRVPTEA